MRPLSIRRFEILYLSAAALGVVNTAIAWNTTVAQVSQTPGASEIAVPMLIGGTLLGLLITLLLWYFTARRASNIAKWITVVLFGISVLSLLISVPSGQYPAGLPGVLGIVGFVLQAIAIVMLFQRDAVAWFKGADAEAVDPATFE